MPNWQQPDLWTDRTVYVPVDELIACSSLIGKPYRRRDGSSDIMTQQALSALLGNNHGKPSDAYVLENAQGAHSAGIRYSDDEPDYHSLCCEQAGLQALLEKHKPQAAAASLGH